MTERTFSAHFDSTAKTISVVVCLMLMVVAWMVHIVFIAAIIPLFIALAYAYSPKSYVLLGDAIVVKRLIGDVRVPRSEIREIRAGVPDDFTGVVRLWGNGGLFGYYGLFRTSKLGKCHWYATDRSKMVVVVTADKTLVLSPDDRDSFLAAAGGPRVSSIQSDVQGSSQSNRTGIFIGGAIAVSALTLVALSLTYSPGPPQYTLTSSALTIHDRFYPVTLNASATDTNNIRIIDLSQESEWRPIARTNGFGNAHYQSGWFRVANGQTVRLYRAGGDRLVLIPPKGAGTVVLYQARDPETFIAQLQRAWTGTGQ